MPKIASSYGVGYYVAAEAHVVEVAKAYRADGTCRGMIYCHPGGSDAATHMDGTRPGEAGLIRAIADAGYPVLSCDLGGALTWGNDTVIARITSAKTYLQGTVGAKSGTVFLMGGSMGGQSMMVWAAANLSSVACAVGLIPVCDVNDIHANNRGGLTASIDAAYGGTYVDATQKAAHNPAYMATVAGGSKFAGLAYKAWYAADDSICIASTVTTLVSNIGGSASAVNVGNTGHSDASIVAVPQADVLAFLAAHE